MNPAPGRGDGIAGRAISGAGSLLLLLLSVAGCNVIGALTYKFAGPMPIAAKYVPQQTPMVIVVERYSAPASAALESETLGRELLRELLAHNIAPQVEPVAVAELESRDPAKFSKMTVSQIGGAVGAAQVLYVNLSGSNVQATAGTSLIRGNFSARVRVIDVATGASLWPTDLADGYPVAVETPMRRMRVEDGESPEQARLALLREGAESIAKLFYKWQPDTEMPE